MVRAYTSDGNAQSDTDDANPAKTYAKQIVFDVKKNGGGNFLSTDNVQLSLDGQQYSNLDAIPEPSGTFLGGTGLLFLLARRKRTRA